MNIKVMIVQVVFQYSGSFSLYERSLYCLCIIQVGADAWNLMAGGQTACVQYLQDNRVVCKTKQGATWKKYRNNVEKTVKHDFLDLDI